MKTGLIGYTGLIGSNIIKKKSFNKLYNSKNILDIKNEKFDLLVFADLIAKKYLVNKNPLPDRQNIDFFFKIFKQIKVKKIILISTIDVYPNLINVNEDTVINKGELDHYGLHRYEFEKFVIQNFSDHHIIRLPMLFGKGLKKNILFDMIHGQFLERINPNSIYQWYNLDEIWSDIEFIINKQIQVINLVSEPIEISSIISSFFSHLCLDENLDRLPNKVVMNIKTKHSDIYSMVNGYLYDESYIFHNLKNFLKQFPIIKNEK